LKFLLGLIVLIFTIKNISAKECHQSDSVKLCFLKYKIKYQETCYKDNVVVKQVHHSKKNNDDITTLEYKIETNKKIGGKNWFHFCFYPVNYYQGICRKQICGYFNIPKRNK
jgi:hypothetical protein